MARLTALEKGRGIRLSNKTVKDVQCQARVDHLVGREGEISRFSDLLATERVPCVVYVHGPGGIGKSSLLEAFRTCAHEQGFAFDCLDARLLPALPGAVQQAVDQVLAEPGGGDSVRILAIDHIERLASLDGWLRVELLPSLPAGIVLVLAGRNRPDAQWHADPGLSELLIDIELEPLESEAVSEYLQLRNVREHHRTVVRDFARGHPLALALAVDQVTREPDKSFDVAGSPDLIRHLVDWLLGDVDEQLRLDTLAACATVRVLDEPLLTAMLQQNEVREEFNWLAEQHFIDRQMNGLMIHDLVRDVIVHELRGRNIEHHHALIRHAAAHMLDGLEGAGQSTALQAIGETIYTLRHEPHVKRQFPFGDVQCYPDSATTAEIPALKAEVAQLEGDESAAWFEYWLGQEGTELLVLRDRSRQPCALGVNLLFDALDLAAGSDDPCVQALFRYLGRHAPLRGEEQVMLTRFMFAHGTHQARTPVWAELAAQLNGLMFTPGIVLLGWASDLSHDWSHISDTADAWILPDTNYEIGGRTYGITAHDLRREPRLQWAHNCVERILSDGDAPELQPTDVVLLGREAFEEAVVEALHGFHDDSILAQSPLLDSPMLRRYSSRPDPDSLRSLIQATSARRLSVSPQPCSLHEALEQVYFVPTSKHRAAAESVYVSERTLRRRLRQAESRLVEVLWQFETQVE